MENIRVKWTINRNDQTRNLDRILPHREIKDAGYM
jgi:hypothetical protein